MFRPVLVLLVGWLAYQFFFVLPEDLFFDTGDYIKKANYSLQKFELETEDGYFVALHRIGEPGNGGFPEGRPPVLLVTGIGCSSDSWLFKGKDGSLPYLLADRGYDVWLGDYRGSHYTKKHKIYEFTDTRFFEYSYHEMGKYDVPVMIDFILDKTQLSNITYIGYSMGTTIFFTMTSTRPEYNQKVNKMIAVAPVLFGENLTEESLQVANVVRDQSDSIMWLRLFERGYVRSILSALFCQTSITRNACKRFLNNVGGYYYEDDGSMASLILSHVPSAPVTGLLSHFLDNHKKGGPYLRDYGLDGNLARYGTPEPPVYDFKKVTVPIYIVHAKEDILAPIKHMETVSKLIPSVKGVKACDANNIGHFDMFWGDMGFADILPHFPER